MSKDAKRIGILGGGQLGRMLLDPLHRFGAWTRVLDPDPDAPCRYVCSEFSCGSLLDFETVLNWGQGCDVITIEIENVNVDALKALQAEGICVYPDPDSLRLIQDKGLQKQFFQDHHILSSPFKCLNSPADVSQFLDWGAGVIKLRRAGYDGKGVFVLSDMRSVTHIPDLPCVLEKKVDIQSEVAILAARSVDGDVRLYDPVYMAMDPVSNLLDYLVSPAQMQVAQLAKLRDIAVQLITKMNIVGLLAIECFMTKSGELWINEVSPRPHNSAHHTIQAHLTSQYEQLARILLGFPLGDTEAVWPCSGVINLVGPAENGDFFWDHIPAWLGCGRVFVHHYGKLEVRPGRKLGHITVVGGSANEVQEVMMCLKRVIPV